MGTNNSNLHKAKKVKNDEFYTKYQDIWDEMKYYKEHFRGKTIFCNCDDPEMSEFTKYFKIKFESLGLKKLITTCYKTEQYQMFSEQNTQHGISLEYTSPPPDPKVTLLEGNGSFSSKECIDILKEADIVITNPPFSLFDEFMQLLTKHNKKFLIIGPLHAAGYKNISPLFVNNKVWFGYNKKDKKFNIPDGNGGYNEKAVKARWFTNLEYRDFKKEFNYTAKMDNPDYKYKTYDNSNAIEVKYIEHIPEDYNGLMGVPPTFLDSYNPDQFEIVSFRKGDNGKDLALNGKILPMRILIRNK